MKQALYSPAVALVEKAATTEKDGKKEKGKKKN